MTWTDEGDREHGEREEGCMDEGRQAGHPRLYTEHRRIGKEGDGSWNTGEQKWITQTDRGGRRWIMEHKRTEMDNTDGSGRKAMDHGTQKNRNGYGRQ